MAEKITRIDPEQLHQTPGYHHIAVVEAGRTAYLAGQCPLDRNGDLVGAGSLETQVDQVVDWLLHHRPEGLCSNLLFTDHGRPVNASRIETAVRRAAQQSGLGRVTPHQLRHMPATPAIHRGMSLEAIAARLGHRSPSMPRVYARMADRTVADEYFAVSEKVEALYDAPRQLPADAEGREMAEHPPGDAPPDARHGYCARPVEMDCHFESICESCTCFVTTIEFRPTLDAGETTRQRRDNRPRADLPRTPQQTRRRSLLTNISN